MTKIVTFALPFQVNDKSMDLFGYKGHYQDITGNGPPKITQLTSGELKSMVLANPAVSGSYTDGNFMFGYRDNKFNIWVGVEYNKKIILYNTSHNKDKCYEDYEDAIEAEINRRRGQWNLLAIPWMDFDDVAQIVRVHISNKLDLYDPTKPFAPWVNKTVANQIYNIIRNHYSNFAKPCVTCQWNEGDTLCAIYKNQGSQCPAYKNWEKSKKYAFYTKLPVSMENHLNDIFEITGEELDIEATSQNLHAKMKTILKPKEWKVYQMLYIQHKDEKEVAKKLGYKTKEKNRNPGYRTLKILKTSILDKVKTVLRDGGIDFVR